MIHFLRIFVMTVLTIVVLTIAAGGLNASAGTLATVAFFTSIPTLAIMAVLHGLEQVLGFGTRYLIAALGLFPTLAFSYLSVAENVKGFGNDYSFSVMIAGLLWAWAWIITANMTRQ